MEKLVFNFDPENVLYMSQLRDLQSKGGGSKNDTQVPSACRFKGDKRVLLSHIFRTKTIIY